MNQVITFLKLKFQLDNSKCSRDMDDFVSNTIQSNFCSFALKIIDRWLRATNSDKFLCLLIILCMFFIYDLLKNNPDDLIK